MPSRNRGSAFVIATFLAGSALAGCSSEVTSGAGGGGGGGASEETIYAIASSLPAYSSLVAAVDKAGLAAALSDAGAELTVFAPDNDAFAALLASVGAAIIHVDLMTLLVWHWQPYRRVRDRAHAMVTPILNRLGYKPTASDFPRTLST